MNRPTRTADGVQVSVTLSALPGFRAGSEPAKARLDLRPELIPGLDPASARDGTLETVVAPEETGVQLVADNLRPLPGRSLDRGIIAVSIDGYDRAYAFPVNFDGTDPPAAELTFYRIDAPRYAVPGRPYAARLEVFNEPEDAKPELRFYRVKGGTQAERVTAKLTTARDQKIVLRVGKSGGLGFSSEVKDWVVPVNTAGVYGARKLDLTFVAKEPPGKGATELFRRFDQFLAALDPPATDPDLNEVISPWGLLRPDGVELPEQPRNEPRAEAKVILDDTPPVLTNFQAVPVPPLPKKEDEPLVPTPPPGPLAALPAVGSGMCVPGCMPPEMLLAVLKPGIPGLPAVGPVDPTKKPRVPAILPLVPNRAVRIVRGSTVLLAVGARDNESGIDVARRVLYFVGSPPQPDGTPAPNSRVIEAVQGGSVYLIDPATGLRVPDPKKPGQFLTDAKVLSGLWVAELDLPDEKGRVTVGVRVYNNAGLFTDALAEFVLVDPEPLPTTGTIAGRVSQGDRPQPGLPVQLLGADGKPVAAAVTDVEGKFKFTELKPGQYFVFSNKAADQNSRSFVSTNVVAGKRSDVVLELKR
jgi:hypothetical protein